MADLTDLREKAEAATPDIVDRLTASRNGCDYAGCKDCQMIAAAISELTTLRAKVKAQGEALKPWANLAELFGFPYNDNDAVLITNGVKYVKHSFTVGDLRRAAQEAKE